MAEKIMGSQHQPKSLAGLFWDILRLSAKAVWGSRGNPVREVLGRQQALAVLGLSPGASKEQIKRRYRTLAKQYHPDRGGDQQKMQQLVAAYELLMKS